MPLDICLEVFHKCYVSACYFSHPAATKCGKKLKVIPKTKMQIVQNLGITRLTFGERYVFIILFYSDFVQLFAYVSVVSGL